MTPEELVSRIQDIPPEVWSLIVLLLKIWIYVAFFLPMIAMRVLQYLGFWPNWWPLG